MEYIVVQKQPLVIFDELTIPIPMSHGIESKAAALRWMTVRGMQAECKVMPMSQFRALSGLLPKDTSAVNRQDA